MWSVINCGNSFTKAFIKILELYLNIKMQKFWFCFDVPEGATGLGRRLPLTPPGWLLLRLPHPLPPAAPLSCCSLMLPAPAGSRSGVLLLAVHLLLLFLHLAGVSTYSGSDMLLPETNASGLT